jgi:hypothetical protein
MHYAAWWWHSGSIRVVRSVIIDGDGLYNFGSRVEAQVDKALCWSWRGPSRNGSHLCGRSILGARISLSAARDMFSALSFNQTQWGLV